MKLQPFVKSNSKDCIVYYFIVFHSTMQEEKRVDPKEYEAKLASDLKSNKEYVELEVQRELLSKDSAMFDSAKTEMDEVRQLQAKKLALQQQREEIGNRYEAERKKMDDQIAKIEKLEAKEKKDEKKDLGKKDSPKSDKPKSPKSPKVPVPIPTQSGAPKGEAPKRDRYRFKSDQELDAEAKQRQTAEALLSAEEKKKKHDSERQTIEATKQQELKKAEDEEKDVDANLLVAINALKAVLSKKGINPDTVEDEVQKLQRKMKEISERLNKIREEAIKKFVRKADRPLAKLKEEVENAVAPFPGSWMANPSPRFREQKKDEKDEDYQKEKEESEIKSSHMIQLITYTQQVIEDPRKQLPDCPVTQEQKDTYRGVTKYLLYSGSRGCPVLLVRVGTNPIKWDFEYYEQCDYKVYFEIFQSLGGKTVNVGLAGRINKDRYDQN